SSRLFSHAAECTTPNDCVKVVVQLVGNKNGGLGLGLDAVCMLSCKALVLSARHSKHSSTAVSPLSPGAADATPGIPFPPSVLKAILSRAVCDMAGLESFLTTGTTSLSLYTPYPSGS
ncbi:hypothetical protein KIPB_007507, partial [Kipferlia bialata]